MNMFYSIPFWHYLILVFVGSISVKFLILILKKLGQPENVNKVDKKENRYFIPFLELLHGTLELLMYSIAFVINVHEFIALWLAVKTAMVWWRKPNENEDGNMINKIDYLIFLIGSSINILVAFAISYIVLGYKLPLPI